MIQAEGLKEVKKEKALRDMERNASLFLYL